MSNYVNPQLAPATRPPRPVNKKMRLKESGGVASWVMLAPSLIFLAVCSIYPFVWIFRYVLYNYDGIPENRAKRPTSAKTKNMTRSGRRQFQRFCLSLNIIMLEFRKTMLIG